MTVDPYKLRPVPPTVCLLTASGDVLSEHGELCNLDALPKGYRVWTSYDTVHELVRDGIGEALCWNREEIRWRHRSFEPGWNRRASDVAVIRLPFYEDEPQRSLAALVAWRDWLGSCGASPNGTTGSAAWSLLRARLEQPLWTSVGSTPPLVQTLGGRQELGPRGAGRFEGILEHLDLPAAYASELGTVRYGGYWQRSEQLPSGRTPEWWARDGRPVFVRARVRIPDLQYGPLPRRPRRRLYGLRAQLMGVSYPTGCTMQGVWTWQEIEAALEHGCTLQKVHELWVHLAAEQPFLPWWESVQQGRAMPGLAGLLAKTTGNALWGRFCMDSRANGLRTIRGRGRSGYLRERELGPMGGLPPSHDLAETVSGRVRARLYRLMMSAGDDLVACHTDGAWTLQGGSRCATVVEQDGWRLKERARRLDLLDPQVLRYWPQPSRPSEPWVVFSGVPSSLADRAFTDAWELAGFAPTSGVVENVVDSVLGKIRAA